MPGLVRPDVESRNLDGPHGISEAVTSPLVIGERAGYGEAIEPGGFHGSFWVAPRGVLDRIGGLDERFENAYWEDDDFLTRLRVAGVPTRQIRSVHVKHVGGLTTVKVPEHREWLARNERLFEEKWGREASPIARFRRVVPSDVWHFCQNCPDWPADGYEDIPPPLPPAGRECARCADLRSGGGLCASGARRR